MQLASGVHVADFGDRAVLLNVGANQYHMVKARHARTLVNIASGRSGGDENAERALLRAGLITCADGRCPVVPQCSPPIGSALEHDRAAGSILAMRHVAIATLEAVARLKWTRFCAVVAWTEAMKSRHPVASGQSDEEIIGRAQAFDRLRMRIPLRRICLRDSLALFALLTRDGLATFLVFGVRLDPFEAHCWVQTGATVLSDRFDNVRQMHPILTI